MGSADFGIPQLDTMISPIPPGSSIVLVNEPGIDAEPFLYQAAASHLADGRRVVYAVTNRRPSAVVSAMSDYGFDVATHGDRLAFIDCFSALMGSAEGAQYSVADPANLAEFVLALEQAVTDHPDAMLVVDSLSSLVDASSPAAFAQWFPRIRRAMSRFPLSAALFTRWPYPSDVTGALAAFDSSIAIQGVEERVVFSQYFTVTKASWATRMEHKPRLFKTIKPGGVLVYIPKILVTGPYNAGKSSFVQSVSDTSVSVDRLGTTVALDHGHVTLDGLTADIFGTPGQARFDPLLRTVAGQALGLVVVVDSTKPESFQRAGEMMQLTWKQGIPAIVAASKQDLPGALAPDEVAKLLNVPSSVHVVACSANERESSRRVLRELIDQILAGGVRP